MIVVMGQGSGDGFFNDAWAFDLDQETWRSSRPTIPAAGHGHAMASRRRWMAADAC